jgi:hypothetical protein
VGLLILGYIAFKFASFNYMQHQIASNEADPVAQALVAAVNKYEDADVIAKASVDVEYCSLSLDIHAAKWFKLSTKQRKEIFDQAIAPSYHDGITAKDPSCATQTRYPQYTFYDADHTGGRWTMDEALSNIQYTPPSP